MPSLAQFADFVKSTGQKVATSPDQILNDAAKNTYFIARMLKGRGVNDTVQSGSEIIDRIQLGTAGTARFYKPNDPLAIQGANVLTSIKVPWRFMAGHYTYTDQELTLNSGDPQTYYKNLLKSKRQGCEVDIFNLMEDALWSAPDNAGMEGANGEVPYCLPAFVTPDGLAPSGFTTVQTANPTTEANWRNQVEQYDPANTDDRNTGLIRAMSRMFHKVKFIAPVGNEYFTNDTLNKMVIATNLDGMTLYEAITRDSNDRLTPANNPGWTAGNVTYAGIPLNYVETLNTALARNGVAWTANEPPFYFLNLMFLYPIYHGKKYMNEKDPMTPVNQPETAVVWKHTYYNLFCRSRRRQGLVLPS